MKTLIKNSNRWCRRTTLEKCLILVLAFIFVLPTNQMAEVLKTTTSINNDRGLDSSNKGTTQNKVLVDSTMKGITADSKPIQFCFTAECNRTAKEVSRKIKKEVKPCDDFYQFACGNYIDEAQIPEDKVVVDTFSVIEDTLQEQLHDIIKEERPETDPKHIKLPNVLYKACMNESLIEKLGDKPIKHISDSLGGWPVILGSSWDSNNTWTWQKTVKKFRRLGFSMDYMVDFSIASDLKNSTKRVIYLDQSRTGLNREYLIKGFNDTLVTSYYDYMVDMAVLFGAKNEIAKIELKESLQFEMDLANISWPSEKTRNSSNLYNLRTVKQLQQSYPYVQWLDYINALLPEGLKINENEVINLSAPSFFDDLGKLLKRTHIRVIANYMMWRIHEFSVNFLSEKFRHRKLQYETALTGKQQREPRWKECVNIVSFRSETDEDELGLDILVGSLYVSKHFKTESKAAALQMVNGIRGIFSQRIDANDWMDQKTKQEAKKKLHAMTAFIGYPDEILENDKLKELYHKLEISSDNYFKSFLNMNVFGADYSFNKLRLPMNKTDWIGHARPAVVNAVYLSDENSIQFPAGILQGHFFNSERPKYMNYGSIGFVIGHEMTHGFDDEGRQFDVNGNLVDWWQPDTKKAFLQKAKCIIEQYGNFTNIQTGLKVNGVASQGENIADNGGIKMSYLAYKRYVDKNGEEPRLPGLSYTSNQLFWISAAQTWCAKYRTEVVKMIITVGFHSPNEFRVVGPFRNMKDFSDDFQCSMNAPMNPVNKCEVW